MIVQLEHTKFDLKDLHMPSEKEIQLSIAISLKRIADELCGNKNRMGFIDTLWETRERRE